MKIPIPDLIIENLKKEIEFSNQKKSSLTRKKFS